ncbi:MAG TPA: hypothetical protein VK678_01650 [Bradyrhizobium sp.]|nr:hypothetical protein [Bradyrhizobium sp.]
MKDTIEQRVETLEKQFATLSSVVGEAGSPKKDWLKMTGRLKKTKFATEADRLRREFRAEQNRRK